MFLEVTITINTANYIFPIIIVSMVQNVKIDSVEDCAKEDA